jgi:membrane-associated phospholipid phosphatase
MHWPTDVLAGWMTGAIWLGATMLVDRIWRVHWSSFARPGDKRD